MALKVEVDQNQSENITERSGTKNNRDWKIRTQSIWVYQPGSKYPLEIDFLLQDDVSYYPPGEYTLDLETAFGQGNFKSLQIDTRKLKLEPVGSSEDKKKLFGTK